MTTVKIKSGDTAIEFTSTLEVNGTAVNLTGASVLFLLKLQEVPFTAYSLAADVVTAASGTVRYLPASGFPTTIGMYKQLWEVTLSNGKVLSFPSNAAPEDEYNYITILDDLN